MSVMRLLRPEDRPSPAILADWLAELGQDLFFPPNVAGWPGREAWLSTQRMIARMRFAAALETGELRSPSEPIRSELVQTRLGSMRLQDVLIARPLCASSRAIAQSNPESIANLLSLPEAQMD